MSTSHRSNNKCLSNEAQTNCRACEQAEVVKPEWAELVRWKSWEGPPCEPEVEAGTFCTECLAKRKRLWLPSVLVPGSQDKVDLMAARVAVGLPACHPGDLRLGTEEGGLRMLEVLRMLSDVQELVGEELRKPLRFTREDVMEPRERQSFEG